MSTLPTELIAEILSFLPPKSLCRFKSVAKSWHSLITSDTFIKFHLSKTLISQFPNLIIRPLSPSSAALSAATPIEILSSVVNPDDEFLSSAVISDENPNQLIFSDVDHPVKHLLFIAAVQVIGSCNGIICISDDFKKNVFYINPSTKTHLLIPPAPTKFPASDRLTRAVVFGFGYDSSVDDYKLLRIVECYVDHVQICKEVRLYSLKSNSWKNVYDNLDNYPSSEMNAVHINGVLYFAVVGENNAPFIKCFDLKTEEFSVFDTFEYGKSFQISSYALAELGGCLAVMASYLADCKKVGRVELWVRKEVSWVRLFQVSAPFKIGSFTFIKPVVYSKDGGKVLLEVEGSKFFWFDLRSNEFTRVEACGIPSEDWHFETYTFVPTIVSLRSDEDAAKDVPKKNVKKKNLAGFLSTGFKLRL